MMYSPGFSAQEAATRAPISPHAPLLHLRDVSKVYGGKHHSVATTALNRLSLDVYQHEFISIMGPSGSGKSTLLNLLAGLDRPTSGELWLQGVKVSALNAGEMAVFRRRHLGFVFQDFNLLDTLTLEENIALPLSMDRQKQATIRLRVDTAMQFLGIADVKHRYPYEVSGGQQQRAAVARAIARQPHIVLADEPTGNLDSAAARALLELFQHLNTRQGTTILLVTHDPLAASYSQRVVFIKDGCVFTTLQRNGAQQQFFQNILTTLADLEGTHERV